MTLVGATGSGKTTLAVAILPAYTYVLAIDPLHVLGPKLNKDPERPTYMVVHTPSQVEERIGRVSRLLYQPAPDFMSHEGYNLVYRIVFESGNRMVYNDEVLRVVRPNGQAPQYLEALLTAGRQRGIGVISSTQRPSKVDLRILSEAEHYAAFRLRLEADLHRMAELMGKEVEKKPATGHNFYYANDMNQTRPILLKLQED